MRSFIVWDVYGCSNGSVRLLARFHFKGHANAVKLASTIHAGYVLRSRVESNSEPRQWESFAVGDHKSEPKPEPKPVPVAEQPATLPPLTLTKVQVWC